MATRTFREKEQQQKSQVFLESDVILMSTLRRITKKELEQVVKNNGDEFYWKKNMRFHSGDEKMRK